MIITAWWWSAAQADQRPTDGLPPLADMVLAARHSRVGHWDGLTMIAMVCLVTGRNADTRDLTSHGRRRLGAGQDRPAADPADLPGADPKRRAGAQQVADGGQVDLVGLDGPLAVGAPLGGDEGGIELDQLPVGRQHPGGRERTVVVADRLDADPAAGGPHAWRGPPGPVG
jgi:hypothetical protein